MTADTKTDVGDAGGRGSGLLDALFVTRLWQAIPPGASALLPELAACARSAAEDDAGGQAWSRRNRYPGYTSYGSAVDLAWRYPAVKTLVKLLDREVRAYGKALHWDLAGRRLELDNLWVNVLDPGGAHGGHIHPHAVVSGTFYVEVPAGASAIRFEDPRLGLMMAAPARRPKAPRDLRPFIAVAPDPGMVLLWEGWLRHEVPPNGAATPRISFSFNYAWR